MKAAPDPKGSVPTESDLTDEVGRRVASRISDRLLEVEKTVKQQMQELLPDIIRCGLGLKAPPYVTRQFEFLGCNGFKGLVEKVVESVAEVHAQQNADEAFDITLSSMRDKGGVWNEQFTKLVENEYVRGYKNHIRSHLNAKVEQPAATATNDVTAAKNRIANAVSHAIGDMRLIHENRLKMLTEEMKSVLEKEKAKW